MSLQPSLIQNTSWKLVSTYNQYFCNNQFLINVLDADSAAEDADAALRNQSVSKQKCLFLHGQPAVSLITEFMSSTQSDFCGFLSATAEEARRKRSEVFFNNFAEDSASELTKEEIKFPSALLEEADRVEPALATINFPIPIESLPLNLAPSAIAPAALLGNWHKNVISDHVWTAGGVSALSFKFKNAQKRVEVTLRGRLGPGVEHQAVHFRAFGPSKTNLLKVLDNAITFHLEDEKPFESALIMIEVEKPGQIEGDARELGFVLFGVDLA